jgi:hypothetical protein
MVHRLLTSIIEGPKSVENFYANQGQIQNIAEHCNEKKASSKAAQEQSDKVFLCIYLKNQPAGITTEAVVVSVGERAFTVYVPLFGYEGKIYVDKLHGATNGGRRGKGGNGGGGDEVQGNLDEASGVLSLHPPAASAAAGAWPPIGVVTSVAVFTLLTVRLTAKDCVPIDVQIDVVGESERNVTGGSRGVGAN